MCIIYFGTLDNTFSFYIGCSDWHHEVFFLPTKRPIRLTTVGQLWLQIRVGWLHTHPAHSEMEMGSLRAFIFFRPGFVSA